MAEEKNFVIDNKKIEEIEEKIIKVINANCEDYNYGEVCLALVNVAVRIKTDPEDKEVTE